MRNFGVLIIVFLIFTSCKNDLKRVEKKHSNGSLKEIYYINSLNQKEGKNYDFFENGKLKSVFNYKQGYANGKAYTFYNNGKLKRICVFYKNRLIDSTFKFTDGGKLIHFEIFNRKQDTLKQVRFYSNGNILDESATIEGSLINENTSNYIRYTPNRKIDYDNSHFVKIIYLNTKANKIHLSLFEYDSMLDTNYYKDEVELFILPDFRYGMNWKKRVIRKVTFPSWNDIVVNLKENEYVKGKLNILVFGMQKNKKDSNDFIQSFFEIQLKKGDKSRWHNVHGIIK